MAVLQGGAYLTDMQGDALEKMRAKNEIETIPTPNEEQHRTAVLAARHREMNERYENLLHEYGGALGALTHALGMLNAGGMNTTGRT